MVVLVIFRDGALVSSILFCCVYLRVDIYIYNKKYPVVHLYIYIHDQTFCYDAFPLFTLCTVRKVK